MINNPHTGSSFDDFLESERLYTECTEIAIKRVIARQVSEKMKQQNLNERHRSPKNSKTS